MPNNQANVPTMSIAANHATFDHLELPQNARLLLCQDITSNTRIVEPLPTTSSAPVSHYSSAQE